MQMWKVKTYSSQGKNHVNQDIVGYHGQRYWVMDGCTTLFDEVLGGNDVQNMMQDIQNYLMHQNDNGSLEELMINGMMQIRQKYDIKGIPKYQLPTFACMLIQIVGDELAYYNFADCYAYIDKQQIVDQRFLNIVDDYSKQYAYMEKDKRTRLIRKTLNQPWGYWIGSMNPIALQHAHKGKINIEHVKRIVLCSDGFQSIMQYDPMICDHLEMVDKLRHITSDDVSYCILERVNDD